MIAPKYSDRTKKPIGTWDKEDKEDKEGKEIRPTRGAKLLSGDPRITNMANKTKHISGQVSKDPALPSAHPPTAAARRALAAIFNK